MKIVSVVPERNPPSMGCVNCCVNGLVGSQTWSEVRGPQTWSEVLRKMLLSSGGPYKLPNRLTPVSIALCSISNWKKDDGVIESSESATADTGKRTKRQSKTRAACFMLTSLIFRSCIVRSIGPCVHIPNLLVSKGCDGMP